MFKGRSISSAILHIPRIKSSINSSNILCDSILTRRFIHTKGIREYNYRKSATNRHYSSLSLKDTPKTQSAANIQISNISDTNTANSNNVPLSSLPFLENGKQTPEDIFRKGNFLSSTTASKQVDTMKLYRQLTESNAFTPLQARIILKLLIETLDEQFYSTYNYKYVRNMELDNFESLYDNLSNELKFEVAQLSNDHLLKCNLKILSLKEDLANAREELNQLLITELQKDSRVDFTNHKIENTLLHKDINSRLKQLDYKINTHLLGKLQSHTEQLRWYTMRNGLLSLLLLVFIMLFGITFNKSTNSKKEDPLKVTLKPIETEEEEDNVILND